MAAIAIIAVALMVSAMLYLFYRTDSRHKRIEERYLWVGQGPDPFRSK